MKAIFSQKLSTFFFKLLAIRGNISRENVQLGLHFTSAGIQTQLNWATLYLKVKEMNLISFNQTLTTLTENVKGRSFQKVLQNSKLINCSKASRDPESLRPSPCFPALTQCKPVIQIIPPWHRLDAFTQPCATWGWKSKSPNCLRSCVYFLSRCLFKCPLIRKTAKWKQTFMILMSGVNLRL